MHSLFPLYLKYKRQKKELSMVDVQRHLQNFPKNKISIQKLTKIVNLLNQKYLD